MSHSDPHELGLWGEQQAATFLEAKGYQILGRRVQVGRDELDLIATRQQGTLRQIVFVEVKTRAYEILGGGRSAVNRAKRHALCRGAAHYLRSKPPTPFRFDIVEVIGEMEDTRPQIRHYENAFPMELRYIHLALHRIVKPRSH